MFLFCIPYRRYAHLTSHPSSPFPPPLHPTSPLSLLQLPLLAPPLPIPLLTASLLMIITGRHVFMGYMYMPDKSAETIDDDGTCVHTAYMRAYTYVIMRTFCYASEL